MSSILDDAYSLYPQHNQAAYNSLHHLLPSDQSLRWSAQPLQGLLWNRGDGIFGCFGLLFCLGGFPFFIYLLAKPLPWFVYFLIGPFLLLGIYLLFGHFLYDQWQRKHTFYGLTKSTLWIKEGKKLTMLPLTSEGHWQKHQQRNRHTWVLRATKDQHSKILAVLGDLPADPILEKELLALQQDLMALKKRSS